jgi:phosphoserine phosphatase RsbU/P
MHPPPPRPKIFEHLDQFWQRVTEGLELGQLWTQFRTGAVASYRLYQKDLEARAPRATRKPGFWHTFTEFSWAILEKLSPSRRVILLLGVILLLSPGVGFTSHGSAGEIRIVNLDFRFVGGALLFILLALEVADRVVMKRDLEIARDIQSWLVPAEPPPVPGVKIAFAARPANTVAGDYYDVFARASDHAPDTKTDQKFLIAVADVAGKSIPAALLMATFQASLKTLSAVPCSLPELVEGMNRYASSNSQEGRRFTTAFLAEFDPASRALTYINAGHNAPVLQRSSGAVEHLQEGGMPLGIFPEAQYASGNCVLQSGDCLVIFTDGLVEAENVAQQEYGEPRLLQVLRAGSQLTPQELLRQVMTDVDAFVGAAPQHDDVTCVLLKAD